MRAQASGRTGGRLRAQHEAQADRGAGGKNSGGRQDGKTVNITTIEPTRWTFRDAISAAQVSAQLIAASLAATDADAANLSDAELETVCMAGIDQAELHREVFDEADGEESDQE